MVREDGQGVRPHRLAEGGILSRSHHDLGVALELPFKGSQSRGLKKRLMVKGAGRWEAGEESIQEGRWTEAWP